MRKARNRCRCTTTFARCYVRTTRDDQICIQCKTGKCGTKFAPFKKQAKLTFFERVTV